MKVHVTEVVASGIGSRVIVHDEALLAVVHDPVAPVLHVPVIVWFPVEPPVRVMVTLALQELLGPPLFLKPLEYPPELAGLALTADGGAVVVVGGVVVVVVVVGTVGGTTVVVPGDVVGVTEPAS